MTGFDIELDKDRITFRRISDGIEASVTRESLNETMNFNLRPGVVVKVLLAQVIRRIIGGWKK